VDRSRKTSTRLEPKKTSGRTLHQRRCTVCGTRFRSLSHFDILCNVCWADNEMRPYLRSGVGGKIALVN
jgi:hypothetical protein